jgi:hypothetical protein
MHKPVVALDCDGVLMQMVAQFQAFIEHQYHVEVAYGDFKHWNPQYNFNIPPADIPKMWDFVWSHPEIPYPGAYSFLRRLEKQFEVHLISKRNEGPAQDHAKLYFPALGVSEDKIHLVGRRQTKSTFVREIGAQMFVDDNPENCTEVLNNTDHVTVFLFSRPWNEGCKSLIDTRKQWTSVSDYITLNNCMTSGRSNLRTI